MRVALLNAPVVTTYGEYSYQPLSLENARRMIEAKGFDSFIGHESTALILSKLLGIDVPVNRAEYIQQGAMTAIVFRLNRRLDTPRELSVEEIEEIGYTLGTLYKVEGILERGRRLDEPDTSV